MSLRGWAAAAALVAATLLAYLPALRADFVWDDDQNVTGPAARTSLAELGRVWADPRATQQYYPLTHSAFWLQRRLWGLDPLGYHLTNVLLHATAALLFWLALARLAVPGAALAAAVFALHPLQVESVAWVTELKNVLSGTLLLATLLAYLGFVRAQDAPRGGGRNHARGAWALALALFALALLAKTAVSPLPVALAALLWWQRGRLGVRELLPLAPLVALGAAAGLLTAHLERTQVGAAGAAFERGLVEKLLVAGKAFWFYPAKLLWPARIAFVYPRWRPDAADWASWVPLAAALAAVAALWAARRRAGRGPLAALLWYGALIFPALGFFNVYFMRYSYVQDHFQYFAGMGLIALGAAGATVAWDRLGAELPPLHWALAGAAARAAAALLLLALATQTWRQAGAYRDEETLWRATLAANPDAWLARSNLCLLLGRRGQLAEAIRHGEEAVRIEPGYAEGHTNLGMALALAERLEEAQAQFVEAVRLDPGNDAARVDLGNVYARRGETGAALAQYQAALKINPRRPVTENNLGMQLARIGLHELAARRFRAALALDGGFVLARQNLARSLEALGRDEQALAEYREILRLAPGDAEARGALARLAGARGWLAPPPR